MEYKEYKTESDLVKKGGLGVIPTDTIYGLVCSAFSSKSVEKIYKLKGRDSQKPLIILISSIEDIKKFNIKLDDAAQVIIKKYWPGQVSIILPCEDEKFSYLHRGTKSIAFRLPKIEWLLNFLNDTGPIVAPSANPESQPPAKNVAEARKYFGDSLDFYIDRGDLAGSSSKLIRLGPDGEERLR